MSKYNLSQICTAANTFRRSGYSLSQAFKLAWRLAKGTASVRVAGVSYERRQTAIEHLRRYSPETVRVSLTREINNRFDTNAIAVYVTVNGSQAFKMGYIPAAAAAILAKAYDIAGGIKARVKAITGGYYADMFSGLRLGLSF